MSEKIFACLLWLYPSRFRRKYAEPIVQLYRDRLRDERGFRKRIRLCFDLFQDAVAGVPQAYRNSYATMTAVAALSACDGVPSFRTLQREPLRPASILMGSFLSLTVIGAFAFVMSRPMVYRHFSKGAMSPIESVLERLNRTASAGSNEVAALAATGPGSSQENGSTSNPSMAVSAANGKLDATERDRVLHAVAQNLNRYYVDPQRAHNASAAVLKRQANGDYDAIGDGQAFAARLTSDLRNATQDPHVVIVFSRTPLPAAAVDPTEAALAEYRAAMLRQNCMFEKIEILENNIGYLKLNSVPDPGICAPTANAAMNRLNGTDAIIFDLRDNMGGYPGMVEQIAAPLFDHSVPWYNPKDPSGSASFIHSPVAGSRLENKPAYILTSARTISAAEQFAYNLKMLKRATLVGETTAGGAHVGVFHRLDDHFGMGIPETRITNPYGKPDWEGSGVQPDVKVPAKDALAIAEDLARKKLRE
jgi:hypothetical protein